MLFGWVAAAVMVVVIDRSLRIGRRELFEKEARYRLFALRDQLRRKAIRGEVACDPWFKYLDTTLTKTIDSVRDLNIWSALAYFSVYGRMEEIESARAELQTAMAKNAALNEIHEEYRKLLWQVIEKRHFLIRNVPRYIITAARAVHFLGRCASWFVTRKKQALDALSSAPPTSTLLEYAPLRRRAA